MDDTINNKQVGERLKSEREKSGMTRDEFSELVGISSIFLAQVERAERQMSINTLVKVANQLNISLDYLIYGENSLEIDKENIKERINKFSKNQLKVLNDLINIILPEIKK